MAVKVRQTELAIDQFQRVEPAEFQKSQSAFKIHGSGAKFFETDSVEFF